LHAQNFREDRLGRKEKVREAEENEMKEAKEKGPTALR